MKFIGAMLISTFCIFLITGICSFVFLVTLVFGIPWSPENARTAWMLQTQHFWPSLFASIIISILSFVGFRWLMNKMV